MFLFETSDYLYLTLFSIYVKINGDRRKPFRIKNARFVMNFSPARIKVNFGDSVVESAIIDKNEALFKNIKVETLWFSPFLLGFICYRLFLTRRTFTPITRQPTISAQNPFAHSQTR